MQAPSKQAQDARILKCKMMKESIALKKEKLKLSGQLITRERLLPKEIEARLADLGIKR